MAKLRVGLLFGGRSVEHEVSVVSATSILRALNPERFEVHLICVGQDGRWRLGAPGMLPAEVASGEEVTLPAVPGQRALQAVTGGGASASLDVVIPMIHGTGGEDGSIQGLLELAGVPYVGARVLGSAVQMDKEVSKRLLLAAGLPVLPWFSLGSHELDATGKDVAEQAVREFGLPLFVKPASVGSSVGISKVKSRDGLEPALAEAARYDTKLLIERGIDAREIEVGVIGTHAPEASLPGEIIPKREFYDYQAKYLDENTELLIPAPLDEDKTREARELALRAYQVVEGSGLARVDFLLDRSTQEFFVSEVNSLPGFTEVSMFPRLWEATGLPYPALLERLIESALELHEAESHLEREFSKP